MSALGEPNLSEEDRTSINEAIQNHGDLARLQRSIYKEAMSRYFNNLKTVSDVEKSKLSSVVSRIPDYVDQIDIEDVSDLQTTVRFLCQDFSGKLGSLSADNNYELK